MNLKRVQYNTKKKCKSPKIYNKQDLPYGTFLVGHEKTYKKFDKFGHKVRNMDANKLKITSTR